MTALLRSRSRVINIGSIGGRVAMPTYGAYAGAKFALEAVGDSLRREVAPLGVRVVVIQPRRPGCRPARPPVPAAFRPHARPGQRRQPAPPLSTGRHCVTPRSDGVSRRAWWSSGTWSGRAPRR
ncbi:SDR family NAD(P)-dependent oxidoreductase [Micromonospora sp. DT233]|uniref:SDR family NAD(P)-dependent oxidoreductase n=1 Tax=Micromonospora sp. DT233 TaxID=3393432 RepID=UPI003CE8A6E6